MRSTSVVSSSCFLLVQLLCTSFFWAITIAEKESFIVKELLELVADSSGSTRASLSRIVIVCFAFLFVPKRARA